jgi:putative transposase
MMLHLAHELEPPANKGRFRHDNAVAQSVFNLLKREPIRRLTYKTHEQARQDIFDHIEMVYNPKRKHVRNAMLSPADFEHRQRNLNQEGI